ncbi:MAG: hypothetical protein K5776_04565, partial [Lachnospiraceae bacterium]|nr:hypothetical protein [Lachnospiraceae bacterium]
MDQDALGYIIMRKNDPITYAEFAPDGNMITYSRNFANRELAPIQDAYQGQWLNLWWKERSVPIEQDNIDRFLRENGYFVPSNFLIKNLGLSLTDYYWLKPIDSDLTWETVNLFDNDFKGNLLNWERSPIEDKDNLSVTPHYSPNGSLQGTIEKSWVINNGERYLIKGNHTNKSAESINEIIACEIHKKQDWKNYCDYGLIHIQGKEYTYGCYSRAFTSQEKELISAWALYTNEKKPNGVSNYNHLLNMCQKYDMNMEEIRRGLEYQILTGFIMTEFDRHLSNIAFLRDADSLKFIGLAPIFDSGGSMFAGKSIPNDEKELMNIKTNSFTQKEEGLLKLVTDRNLIDLTKLPPASYIKDLYEKDPLMSTKEINNITYWYEKKID